MIQIEVGPLLLTAIIFVAFLWLCGKSKDERNKSNDG